ncbi:MAG: NAD-dependent epimerase/dehydratase family protein [Sphingobacteriia bacterium]|nr:NAD-dependent epimerase/dehydratase family protein [Sphingobacteriia bacterium]
MIFVTGGTGLLGAHLLFELVQQHERVRALKRSTSNLNQVRKTFSWYSSDAEALFSKIEWVEGDLLDWPSIVSALEGVEKVFHCAGMVSFRKKDSQQLIFNNQQGTANLVNACQDKGNVRFCHVSSVSALGRAKQNETLSEKSLWKPSGANSAYAISKYGAEREVWRANAEGLDMFIVNPSVIIGPGDWLSGSSQLFTTVYQGMPFYTGGITGYIDVRDVARIMIQLMKTNISGERFILSAEDLAFRQVLTLIAIAFNKKPPGIKLFKWMAEIGWRLDFVISLLGQPHKFTRQIARSAFNVHYYNNAKISKLLNYSFIPIEESIKQTASVFLKEEKQ